MEVKIYISIYQEPLTLIQDTISRLLFIGYDNIQARLDGVFRIDVVNYLSKNGVDVYVTKNLKQIVGKGANTNWYLTNFVKDSSVDYLIKIDPDTLPIRKLNYLPQVNMLGTNISTKRITIFGGCIVFSKFVATKIVQSELLLEDKFLDYTYYSKKLQKNVASQDMIIYEICNCLNIKYDAMINEICCIKKNFTTDKRFAFCHFND